MTLIPRTIAVVNGTGRQAASVIRSVTALGWSVKAQVFQPHPIVLEELQDLENVEIFEQSFLDDDELVESFFEGCDYAFVNTFPVGDEIKLGKALADAAKRHKVKHYLYCSMPDHSRHDSRWPALPNWACKFEVEEYIRSIGLPATFLYAGIYNNNFTSLDYPLFCMDFKDNGTIEWVAPFHPNTRLPWLDAETDTGPAVLQILKDGVTKWKDKRIALAFQNLTPNEVCQAFERALGRPCKYVFDEHIEVRVPIPENYRRQLAGIEVLFGKFNAPYLPLPELRFTADTERRRDSSRKRSNDKVSVNGTGRAESTSRPKRLTSDARRLWPGFRRIEDYAREAFLVEEEANGKDWMKDKSVSS
ncbi:hypothetical protein BT93_L5237 [Corymbia citriodora subsp. variegata]|uniref:NmrA-like domain-containing protein n=1 Tax=Corymbia citriodora subsp. variegata TaxID=360336 RepID=A0A8T0CJ16_CORYI|nr:hypothetical protein BT93_L5237 [Corymbia citriodora subsp. variegata]